MSIVSLLLTSGTDFAIHNVPLFALPAQQDLLTPEIAEAISFATGASISHARFLSKPENRAGKNTTSIVISVPVEDTEKIGPSIRLFGRVRRCNKLWPATPNTLCRKCARLGHATEGCQASTPTCSICAGSHPRRDHRCPNPSCPKEGHLKPITDCTPCPSYNPKCVNCGGPHPASSRDCPARRPPAPASTQEAPPAAPLNTPAPTNNQTPSAAQQSESVATGPLSGPEAADTSMEN